MGIRKKGKCNLMQKNVGKCVDSIEELLYNFIEGLSIGIYVLITLIDSESSGAAINIEWVIDLSTKNIFRNPWKEEIILINMVKASWDDGNCRKSFKRENSLIKIFISPLHQRMETEGIWCENIVKEDYRVKNWRSNWNW